MHDLENFLNHLKSITATEWSNLFELNERIMKSKSFGEMAGGEKIEENVSTFPYWKWSDITSEFFKIVHDMKLIVSFDWPGWEEGIQLLKDYEQTFQDLDEITLCKLLTVIIRADRFSDGTLVGAMEDGTISKILSALKALTKLLTLEKVPG